MFSKNYLLFLLISIVSFSILTAEDAICPTQQNCKNLNNPCKCYCSHKCGPRDKKADDRPIWIENDPEGNFCYCKQWDLDNYKKRCAVKNK